MPPKINPTSSSNNDDISEKDMPEWKKYVDFKQILPEFDPVDDMLTINEWITKIEKYGKVYGIDENGIRHHALLKLTGVAKEWLDSLGEVENTWKEWKDILIENFPVSNVITIRRQKAENYKRTRGMDISIYYYKKLALCNKASMVDSEIIERVVEGIPDHRFRNFLGPLRKYQNPAQLLLDLKEASYIFDGSANSGNGASSSDRSHANNRNTTLSNRTFNNPNEPSRRNEGNYRGTHNFRQF